MDELSEDDKLTVERARKIQRFMSQPFQVAEVFTGIEGRLVPLKEVSSFQFKSVVLLADLVQTVDAFEEILDGKHDHISESSFYICWKLREDKRVNEVLLQLYPDTKFAIDVAVMRLGQDGQMVPLRGYPNILQAFYAIKRYVHNHNLSEVLIQ